MVIATVVFVIALILILVLRRNLSPKQQFQYFLDAVPAENTELKLKQYRWIILPKLVTLAQTVEEARQNYQTELDREDLGDFQKSLVLFKAQFKMLNAEVGFKEAYILTQKFGYNIQEPFNDDTYRGFLLNQELVI